MTGDRDGMTNGCSTSEASCRKGIVICLLFVVCCVLSVFCLLF